MQIFIYSLCWKDVGFSAISLKHATKYRTSHNAHYLPSVLAEIYYIQHWGMIITDLRLFHGIN